VDVIATPTSPTVAFGIGERVDDPWAMYASDVLTVPVNLAGLPGISIPCGLSEGLPVGFQLIGPVFAENRLLETAHAVEQAVGFDPVPPDVRGVAA
jgi:aspartyl-tRNA(Asn)/glutamyl-tRNA(Gln) amidotransferase subunit A